MAEWLGTGLQNRLQQFDSAWYLSKTARFFYRSGLFFNIFSFNSCGIGRFFKNPFINVLHFKQKLNAEL